VTGQARGPAGVVLDDGYEQLREAALHARAEAFPLGLGVLTAKGVTAWRRAVTGLASAAPSRAPATGSPLLPLPGQLAAELVNALTAVALAGV
jgi:hypothetical protein